MQCDICGKEAPLRRVKIEGSVLNVCKQCSAYGQPITTPKPVVAKTVLLQKPVLQERIVDNFAKMIRDKREQLRLKQEEFAKQINEKDSLIHKIETGHIIPSIKLGKKIGRFLGLKLVEQDIKTQEIPKSSNTTQGFTLGDMLKK